MTNPIGFLAPAIPKIPRVSQEETREIPESNPVIYDYVTVSTLKNFKGFIIKPTWFNYFRTQYPDSKESTETILITCLVLALLLDIWSRKDSKNEYPLPKNIKKELNKNQVVVTPEFMSRNLKLEQYDVSYGLMKLEFYDLIKTQTKKRKVDKSQMNVIFVDLDIVFEDKLNEISK